MQYLSKNKDYMQGLKTSVYMLERKNGNEQLESWEHVRRYIVINDLYEFIKNDSNNPNHFTYCYNSNLINVDYFIVSLTENQKELAILDNFLKSAGITNYYRTSYSKSSSGKVVKLDSLTASLKSEMKLIDAKKNIIFSPLIGEQLLDTAEIHTIIDNKTIVTNSFIQVLQADKFVANRIKNVMWKDFKKLELI